MSSNIKKEAASTDDKDLDDLLDSALNDFSKTSSISTDDKTVSTKNQPTGEGGADADNPDELLWNEEFIAEQAKLLEEKMNQIFGSGASAADVQTAPQPDQIAAGLQKMAEAAALALQGGDEAIGDPDNEYAKSIKEALQGMKEGVTDLQSPISQNDVANMFSGLSLDGAQSDGNPFLPFMQGMMQSLLSAEILLPSMKDLLEKYPQYLEDNKDKISAEDMDRYKKQQKLFEVICVELETENPDDSAVVKQERFKKVLDNMQKLHEYGQPPEDLIGDVGGTGIPGLDPAAAGGGQQCPLM